MSIPYHCSACGHAGQAAEKYAGRVVKCPSCEQPINVEPVVPLPPPPFSATAARVSSPPSSPRLVNVDVTHPVMGLWFTGFWLYLGQGCHQDHLSRLRRIDELNETASLSDTISLAGQKAAMQGSGQVLYIGLLIASIGFVWCAVTIIRRLRLGTQR